MIDLSKLQEGDTVKFRCGGESLVTLKCKDGSLYFDSHQWGHGIFYKNNGKIDDRNSKRNISDSIHSFDIIEIIEIISKPFDWKDASYGNAFLDYNHSKKLRFFLCPSPNNNQHVYVGSLSVGNACLYNVSSQLKHTLIRAPEHDIEVQS